MTTPQQIVEAMQEARRELEIRILKINANLQTYIEPRLSRFLKKAALKNPVEWPGKNIETVSMSGTTFKVRLLDTQSIKN